MKITQLLVAAALVTYAGVAKAENSPVEVKFAKPLSCKIVEKNGVTMASCSFKIACNQKFVEVIRKFGGDVPVTVYIGGLIQENTSQSCTIAPQEIEVNAGEVHGAGWTRELRLIGTQ